MEPLRLNDAVEALKRDPSRPVVARVDDLTVELRALSSGASRLENEIPARDKQPRALRVGEQSAADIVREIGAWEGEPLEELLDRCSRARRQGGSRSVPEL